jgi:tryptophan synthase alpha chain
MAGDPDMQASIDHIRVLDDAGADFIELGTPFSDPLADGKTNQLAAQRALDAGFKIQKYFDLLKAEVDKKPFRASLILFTYLNPIFKYGIEKFAMQAKALGFKGLLILDLPPENADSTQELLEKYDLTLIPLLSPTTKEHRIEKIRRLGTEFVYCVSRTGVTGTHKGINPEVLKNLKSLNFDRPMVLGFGISSPEIASQVCEVMDGAVVGSAIVNIIAENKDSSKRHETLSSFCKGLRESI